MEVSEMGKEKSRSKETPMIEAKDPNVWGRREEQKIGPLLQQRFRQWDFPGKSAVQSRAEPLSK
jgi:hypothetical protein